MPSRLQSAAVLLLALGGPAAAQTPAVPATPPVQAAPAYLTLGGYNVLCLRGAAGGLSPAERVDVILGRVTPLLGYPVILPSDVVVYLPPEKSRYNRYPVIYALGRRIVTVDPATVKASGLVQTPLQAATLWAQKLQQVLPRVNWRPSNAPEPKIPAHPPLRITHDFAQVGGMTAAVSLRGHVVLKLHGPQLGGMTAAERADMLSARLERLADQPAALAPDAVQAVTLPTGAATLSLTGTPLLSVTPADAKLAGFASADLLAEGWAKNLRLALAPPAPAAAPVLEAPPAAAGATPGATSVAVPGAETPAPASAGPAAAAPDAPATPPAGG